ncbi:DNA clamp loader [Syncephalastrum racemosum]|uniref:DNA clamp loader n=1 Tax=Syncephalastrum racemosum TaxID=13706 RepID=A0A1X2HTQ3_SYNRA|nr:DNA clamp loader [Syncephalastrum racemosum]
MSLWTDKYKPTSLDKLTFHDGLTQQLKSLADSDNFPHLLFYGPSGAGKKTRLAAVLRQLFGPGVEKLKIDQRQFATTSNRKMTFTVVSSNYHLELNPSELEIYDRVIVQDVIKNIAQTQQVDSKAKHNFKVVVIDQADMLTRDAQAALRRTMEKYTPTLRLILCCNSLSKIIAPVRSRCLLVRVPRPNVDEVTHVLHDVATKEGFSLPQELAVNIALQAQCNVRAAMLKLESAAVRYPKLSDVKTVEGVDWELAISKIAGLILKEQSAAQLIQIRGLLYEMLSRSIQPDLIMKRLAFELADKMDLPMQKVVIEKAAYHEHRMRIGRKYIIHLEAFVASVMHAYKCHTNHIM